MASDGDLHGGLGGEQLGIPASMSARAPVSMTRAAYSNSW